MKRAFWAAAALLLLGGCQGEAAAPEAPTPSAEATAAPEGHNTHLSEELACQALAVAPKPLMARTAAPGPALEPDMHYAVTMPEGDRPVGMLRFHAPTAGEWTVYLERDVFLVLRESSGQIVSSLKYPGSEQCTGIAVQRVYELEPGDYDLELGPTEEASFGLVIEETHPGGAGEGP